MENILQDRRLELFFGIIILFFSFVGILGYIPTYFVINVYFLLLFFLGIMLGSMLILASISDYFQGKRVRRRSSVRRRRR